MTQNPETQNKPEPETQNLENMNIEELGPKDLIKIVNDVLKNKQYQFEARYVLLLEDVVNDTGLYYYRRTYDIVVGVADEILLKEERYNQARIEKYLIIPRTVPVIIREYITDSEEGESEIIYIFTSSGWKSIEVK